MKFKTSLLLGAMLLVAGAAPACAAGYTAKILVSDQAGKAPVTDPNLVNAWGLAQAPGGPAWVSDNGTNLSTVYNRTTGAISNIVVNIPLGFPTGMVFTPSSLGFTITENGVSGPAAFIFDTESGAIEGWSSSVDGANAVIAVDNSGAGAVYKGLAVDNSAGLLYAANFAQNKVEVYNNQFQLVKSFTDKSLPKRYAPFNVVDIGGTLYVSFAERDKAHHDEIDGPGLGYVDTFDTNGKLLKHLIAQGPLNAPWGMAMAPASFGAFSGDLLVGNFGDGWINVFDPSTGTQLGSLMNAKGSPIVISGLWALDSGPGSNQVNYSAGPKKESHGAFGIITPN